MGIISAYAGSVAVWSIINTASIASSAEKAVENGWVDLNKVGQGIRKRSYLPFLRKVAIVSCVPLLRALLPVCFVYMSIKKKEDVWPSK